MKIIAIVAIIVFALASAGALYVWYNHNRYELVSAGTMAIAYRIDKNTGQVWMIAQSEMAVIKEPNSN